MNKNRKQFLDDMFGALSIMSGGHYVSLYDIKGKMTRYSAGAVELFDLPGEYIPDGADNWADHLHNEDKAYYLKVMDELIKCNKLTYDLTYRVRQKNGSYGLFRFKGAVIRDDTGSPSLVGGLIINEGALDNTDPVTVLRNRYGFFRDLAEIQKMGRESTIMLIGIDRLAEINEEQGYGYGNELLRQVGWTIRGLCEQDGFVYRMEGSKFAFITNDRSVNEVSRIYSKIRKKLQGGIEIDGMRQSLNPCASVITVNDREMSENAIYTCLLYAYTESKKKKHGNLVIFNGAETSDGIDELKMTEEIHNDMLNGFRGFSLNYQPVYKLAAGNIAGVETLLRWHSDKYGEVLPSRFMPIIEHDYALSELTLWITRRAMLDGLAFFEKNDDMFLGINISAAQIEDDYFIPELIETAGQTKFPLNRLIIEMGKDCRLLDPETVKTRAAELRANGIKLLLDDFGSGFSSIGVLKTLKADYIKFDLSFVDNITDSENDRNDLEKLSELCSSRGCDVCVKGIENEKMHGIIKGFPITSVQGFHYAAPMRAEQIIEILK